MLYYKWIHPMGVLKAKQLKSCDAKLKGLTLLKDRHGSQFPLLSAYALNRWIYFLWGGLSK